MLEGEWVEVGGVGGEGVGVDVAYAVAEQVEREEPGHVLEDGEAVRVELLDAAEGDVQVREFGEDARHLWGVDWIAECEHVVKVDQSLVAFVMFYGNKNNKTFFLLLRDR